MSRPDPATASVAAPASPRRGWIVASAEWFGARVPLHLALLALVIGLFAFYHYGMSRIWNALKYGFALEVIVGDDEG